MSDFPLVKTNYLSIDYLTLRDELLAKIPLLTSGRWTNLNESDPGITMLELLISMTDNLMFYLDMQGQELDISRARQRANVIRLLRLINYEINGVRSATGTITFGIAPTENPTYPVTIQKGTQATAQSTSGSLIFTTMNTVSLIGPTDKKTVSVIQGSTSLDSFVSDGSQNQKFILSASNIDRGTVVVFIDDNPNSTNPTTQWDNVTSFYNSDLNSHVYKTETDENSRVFVIFGDGQFGKIPVANAQINISYIESDGEAGNVGRNAINQVISNVPLVVDAKGNKVQLSVINSEATAGGADIESIEHAKATAAGLLFALNRAMSKDDYTALMTSLPGVDKAVAWGENEESNPDYRLMNRVRVTFFSNAFKDMFYNDASRASYRSLRDNQLRPLLTSKMPITTRLVFIDPVLIDIFVSMQIGIDTSRYDPNIVLDQVRFNILNQYDISSVVFGQDVRISTLTSLAQQAVGVSWARVTRLDTNPPTTSPDTAPQPPLDIVLEKWKIPTLVDSNTMLLVDTPTNVTPPYVQAITPTTSKIGQNDITVINPDLQSDIFVNGYSYFPSSNLPHISLSYTSIVDEPSPQGGFYGNPTPEADDTTYYSVG